MDISNYPWYELTSIDHLSTTVASVLPCPATKVDRHNSENMIGLRNVGPPPYLLAHSFDIYIKLKQRVSVRSAIHSFPAVAFAP